MRLHRVVCSGLLLLPMIFVASRGEAQATVVPPSRFGIVVGVNSATWAGSDATNPTPDRHTAGMIGANFVKPVSAAFAFQPELLYSMKGAEVTDPGGTGVFKFNYIEIPLLLRFDVAVTGGVKPFFYAGPTLSLQMSCNAEFTNSGVTASESCGTLESQSGGSTKFTKSDYGVIAGGGLAFDASGRTFTIGLRYDHGLAKIEKSSEIFNRVISLVGTYEFPHRQ